MKQTKPNQNFLHEIELLEFFKLMQMLYFVTLTQKGIVGYTEMTDHYLLDMEEIKLNDSKLGSQE